MDEIKPQIELTEEQQRAVDYVLKRIVENKTREVKIGGYAGTGKTTISKEIVSRLDEGLEDEMRNKSVAVAVAAFTGKACSVLRRKGLYQAQTLHSLIYNCQKDSKGNLTWVKRPFLEYDVVLVDEASMVSTELYRDLLSFTSTQFIWVGDPGQLPPVGDNPNLMGSPDVTLEKIHRQAEGNPIIKLATDVRNDRGFGGVDRSRSEIKVISKTQCRSFANDVDQIICGFNRTRIPMNTYVRESMGCKEPLVIGERLICLKNNREFGVFNGLQLVLEEINADLGSAFLVTLRESQSEDESFCGESFKLLLNKHCLQNHGWDDRKFGPVPSKQCLFDYAYCVTCHKAQGSEWDKVLVIDEANAGKLWEPKRWKYTAVTRAAKELIYAS